MAAKKLAYLDEDDKVPAALLPASDELVYDNSDSGLTAANVKAALDELAARLDVLEA